MTSEHRIFKKHFETEILVNNTKLSLNHFVQETIANMMTGFLKTLTEFDNSPKTIEITINKLAEPIDVDAHQYP